MKREFRNINEPPAYRFHINHGTSNAPLPTRRPTGPRPLAPGYLWNGTYQQLIPILAEDHPNYRENAHMISETIKRWDRGER